MTWKGALLIPGALSEFECDVLATVAHRSDAQHALEVGHLFGRSTVVLLESLPDGCEFLTVDHHRGDGWSGQTSVDTFDDNVAPHVKGRPFQFHHGDMMDVDWSGPPFGFVFYDADHTATACAAWWRKYEPFLAPSCTLVYDDADWPSQAVLGELAQDAGFQVEGDPIWQRGPDDKLSPETFTLQVLSR